MTIIGQTSRSRRRRGRGGLVLAVLAVLLVALFVFAYAKGGERPLERIEKPVAYGNGGSSDPAVE